MLQCRSLQSTQLLAMPKMNPLTRRILLTGYSKSDESLPKTSLCHVMLYPYQADAQIYQRKKQVFWPLALCDLLVDQFSNLRATLGCSLTITRPTGVAVACFTTRLLHGHGRNISLMITFECNSKIWCRTSTGRLSVWNWLEFVM